MLELMEYVMVGGKSRSSFINIFMLTPILIYYDQIKKALKYSGTHIFFLHFRILFLIPQTSNLIHDYEQAAYTVFN